MAINRIELDDLMLDDEWDVASATHARARRHSKLVSTLKLAFMGVALLLGGVVALFAMNFEPLLTAQSGRLLIDRTEVRMVNPRFTGQDDANRGYVVIANTARKTHLEPHKILLDRIRANVEATDEPGILLTALSGILETERRFLELTGDIRMRSSDGYHMATEAADADLKSGVITGDKDIVAHGPFGTLRADSFTVYRNDKHMRFVGNVKVRIEEASSGALAPSLP